MFYLILQRTNYFFNVKPTLNLKYIQAIFILHVSFSYKTILIHKQTLLNTSLSNYPASVHLIHFFQIIIFLTIKSSCKRNEWCCYNSKITRYPFFFFFVLPKYYQWFTSPLIFLTEYAFSPCWKLCECKCYSCEIFIPLHLLNFNIWIKKPQNLPFAAVYSKYNLRQAIFSFVLFNLKCWEAMGRSFLCS